MRKHAFLFLLLAALLCGCKGNNLVGKWNVSGLPLPIPGATVTSEFTSTDVFLFLEVPNFNVKQKFVGTYKMEGDTMTTNFTDMVIEGQGAQADMAKASAEMLKPQILQALNKDPKTTIVWKDKDTFTSKSSGSNNQVTFSRIP